MFGRSWQHWLRRLQRARPRRPRGQCRLVLEQLEDRLAPATVSWVAGSGDWDTAANWLDASDQSNHVPGVADDVVINTAGVTVTHGTAVADSVRSLTAQADLSLTAGSLQVMAGSSAINGALTLAAGASLTATGAGTSFTASGTTSIDNANLYATAGATLSLPGVQSYANGVDYATTLSASGAGSVLALPNLASMTATTDARYFGGAFSLTQVRALSGGAVELPALTQISGGPIQLSSDGSGSVLDVSALTSFTGVHTAQNHNSALQATTSGTLKDGSLTTLSDVDLVLDGSGSLAIAQLTSFTGAALSAGAGTLNFTALTAVDGSSFPSVSGLTLDFPAVTSANGASFTVGSGVMLSLPLVANIDNASFQVSGGSTVHLPRVTSYANGVDSTTTLSASGTGSVLSLPNLASMTATTDGRYFGGAFSLTQVRALSGGAVELPALTQISGGPIQLSSDGSGSVLDVSALTSFTGVHTGQNHASALQATTSGTLKDGSLSTLSDVDLVLDGSGTLAIAQLTGFTGAALSAGAGTLNFTALTAVDGSSFPSVSGLTLKLPALTSANGASFTAGSGVTLSLPLVANIDNASFQVSGGSTVSLPRVTSYANSINGGTTLSASGTGSVLALPNLASMTANTDNGNNSHYNELLQVEALAGGDVELPALTQISGGPIQLTSDGAGSVLNVAALGSFTGVSNGFPNASKLAATNGGTLKDDSLTTLVYVNGTLPPRPDLVPSAVAAPANGLPLQSVPVTWTLTNSGNADAVGSWTVQVLLATDAAGDNPTLLQASADAGPLAQNQPVSRSANVPLPNVAPGNYWLVVHEDALGEVRENITANNTAVASAPIAVGGGLTLVLARHAVSDAAGASATTATVTRNTDTTGPLTVMLASSGAAGVAIPQTVTIPAGQASVRFAVGTVNAGLVVGTQTATLTASATGVASGSDTLTVTDVNVPTLTLTLGSHALDETTANPATTATITRNTATTAALVVALLSDATGKLSVPATVTIPAGQASATFPVTVVNDQQLDGNTTVTVTAASAGFVPAADSAIVIDDDAPTLTLTLAQPTVSEAAGAGATTGTVSLPHPASTAITIALASSDMTAATVPTTVVIAAGQLSAPFAVTAIDDSLVLGDKTTTLTARVETNAGILIAQGAASANLLLKEADGPALTLTFAASVVSKGATATGTVTRNTDVTAALVVNLSSSDTSRATVPATVTIAAGQTSASFTIASLDNHTPDGLKQVQLTASANGLATGLTALDITDVDLPDLAVAGVTVPAGGYDGTPLPISWTVSNSGQYPASGSWLDQVYLDPLGGPLSSTPADTVPFTGTISAGQHYTQTDTLAYPATVGQYTVRIVTDSDHSLQELSFTNNTSASSQPLNDQAAYQATVSTTATTVSSGTPIPLTGAATLTGSSTPAASVPVAVEVMVAGTTRTLTANTDAAGHYSVTFQPLANEAGQYTVAASDPGVPNPAVQAHFTIVGLTASPAAANVEVVPGTPLTGQFTLTNLGATPLTGLTATASGGPAGVRVQVTPPGQLAGGGSATLAYRIDATGAQAASGVVTLHVAAAEGAVLDILLEVTVLPLSPSLTADPGFLNTGMVVGAQSFVSFTVVNHGGAPSGDLHVSLPDTSYLALASAATIPSLAPGASATVTLELSPPANLPLAQYTGTLAVSNGQTGIGVPFTFTAITSAVGTVQVLVDDDYTFDVAGSPHVQGATVNLLNPYDNTQIVATGVTDANGTVTFPNVPAGPYQLQVQASGHSTYNSSYTVVAGITNNDEVFVARQFVSYTWQVQQTTIQDQYQIQLKTEFQTNVPAPVVTISAPSGIPPLLPGQSATFNVTVTNHGLIAAQGVALNLPSDAEYTFTALTTQLGVLPAESSVVVPVTVTRANNDGLALTAKLVVPQPVSSNAAATVYVQYANTGTVPIPAPLLVVTATQNGNAGAFLSLDSSRAGLAYTADAAPAGFTPNVQLLASGASPGVLAPGESETIPVYYAGWRASEWLGTAVTFNVSVVSAANKQQINWTPPATGYSAPTAATGTSGDAAAENQEGADLRPSSISAAAWAAVNPIVTANLGSTWGQYVQTLDSDAVYLAGLGAPTNDLSQLVAFEVEKANAAYTAQTLATVTAADLPAPGLPLSFVQSFQQSIAGRYTSGILGFGWTTNWDISAAVMTTGDVAIKHDGMSEYFGVQPNGTFAPQAGDAGTTLTSGNGAFRLVKSNGTAYQFNVNGTLSYVQDTNGNRITAGYDATGRLASLTHSNGEYLNLTYNAQGHLSQLTDSTGQTETYGYDPTGQYLASYTDVDGTTNYTYITSSSLAQNNALAAIAYADNTHIFFTYDATGRLIDQHRDGGAEDKQFSYLTPGGLVTTDGDGNKSTTFFDRYGDTAETIDARGNVSRFTYDANLNLVRVVAPGGLSSSYSYDANGNRTSETDPLGKATFFTYNASNHLTSYTDAKGNKTAYGYDSSNNKLMSVTYADTTSEHYSYNPLGEATGFLNANGDAITSTFNNDGLVTKESFADGTSFSYTYNALGNMTGATDAQGNITTFVYAEAANPTLLTEVQYADGTWLKFTYNIVGQRLQSLDQTGFTVNYSYDALGRLAKLTDGTGGLIVQYLYDNAGRLIQKNNGNGTFTVYTYDGAGNVLSITNYAPSTGATSYVPANSAVNSFDNYTYDPLGNVQTDTNQDGQWVYVNDADSQLTSAVFTPNGTDPDGLAAQNLQYAYDAAGNRSSETVNGVTTAYVANNVNEYTSSATNGVATNYQYDNNGNLTGQTTGGSTTNYTFNELHQLTAVNGPGLSASYTFDALGNRNSQTINGVQTKFQFDGGAVVASFTAGGALTAHFTYGLGLASQVSAAATAAYYDFNLDGSAVGVTGTGGSYVNQYAYLPFGQTTTIAATVTNPFTFVGQFGVTNDGSGAFEMGYRQYDPAVGQFLSNDPLNLGGGDTNIRRYTGNNPVNRIDPQGLGGPEGAEPISEPAKGPQLPNYIWGEPGWESYPMSRWKVQQDSYSSHEDPNQDADVAAKKSRTQDKVYRHHDEYIKGGVDGVGGWPNAFPPLPLPTPDPDDQPCTVAVSALSAYDCGRNKVFTLAPTTISIPGRDCDAPAVQLALASVISGGAGGSFVTGAAVQSPPETVQPANCNPYINNFLQQTSQTRSDASDPPIDTTPPVTGTNGAASAAGPPVNESPAIFLGTALGNLGLLNGQVGNDGYTAAQAAQVTTTIATFDQTEADLAGIFATAVGNGASLGITGDLNLLHTIDARLQAVTSAEDLLFGGDANWLKTTQPATLQQWLAAFFTHVQASSDGSISSADRTQLLAITLPGNVGVGEATEFLDRWDRTVHYWGLKIFNAAQVPAGQSTDFLDLGALQTAFKAAQTAEQQSQVDGYADVGAEAIANLTQVQQDLTGQGTCATVKLQIDQTATLTRSAFAGTLTITNGEATGALGNVVMHIAITDAQGNPANGQFFISSPTYSGAFNVVGGNATLPNGGTGSLAFTFIPDNTAAPAAPAVYRIGGTIGFTDPDGGAFSASVFPADITVLPQPQLQLNYFLQQTVIGTDPFNPQEVIPSEPAVLGLLVTNVGGGTARQLSLASAQPKIVENAKGLLVNIQIVGTQVGTQQVTPSLTVNFGDLAPGQTGDADFLITSSLQGTFTDFTATFTHADALGGQATSLIQSVTTHTLVHAGNFAGSGSTGAIDYLSEENANPGNLPDTIYFANGTTAPVHLATNATATPAAAQTYTVTANVTSGWTYLQLPDPGAGDTLSKVVRSDGTVLALGDQAWTSDRTISSTGKSAVDHQLHLVDLNSTGSYTVYYTSHTKLAPTVTLTAPADGSVSTNAEPTLTAQVADRSGSGLASVQFQTSGDGGMTWTKAGPAETSSPFLYPFASPLAPGTYQARAVATDNAANVATSAPVTFTILTAPVLTASTASLAANAASLTIHGSGFDTNPANDRVTFDNGVIGTVTGATPSSLSVHLLGLDVLTASTALHASVSVDGSGSGSAVPVATAAPVLTANTADLAADGTKLTIGGLGFDTNFANDGVSFDNGVTGTVTGATPTSLTVRLSGLTSVTASTALHASVTVNGTASGSPVQVARLAPAITANAANLPASQMTLVIHGAGFDGNAANDRVTLSSGSASVMQASATTLTIQLSGVRPGSLTAVVRTDGVDSGSSVAIATVVPGVTASTALLPPTATSLTIAGYGFDANLANDVVTFSGSVKGTVTSATPTRLIVSNLTGLAVGSLSASVKVDGVSSGGPVQVAAVSLNADSKLVLQAQPPSKVGAGAGFSVTVKVLEANGQVDAAFHGPIALSLTGPGSLAGPTLVVARAGVATFAGLTIDTAGSGDTLVATSAALTPATSQPFTVAPGQATQLVVTAGPPATVAANAGFAVAVAAEDAFGNVVSTWSAPVSLTLRGTGKLLGKVSAQPKHGLATFSGLLLDTAASVALQASSGGLAVGVSSPVTVTPGAATHLVVAAAPPASVNAAAPFGLTIQAEDAYGNVAPSFSGMVSLTLTGAGALGGTASLHASAGIATFSNLSISASGRGDLLKANATGLTATATSPFTVAANLPDVLVFTTEPPPSIVAGTGFTVVVKAEIGGVVDTHYNGVVSLALAGLARFSGPVSVNARAGVATFTGLSLTTAGSGYTFQASAAGLVSVPSTAFAVTPAAVRRLVISAPAPASVTAGTTFGLTVAAVDAYGNVNPSFTGTINLALSGGPGTVHLNGIISRTASAGSAVFTGLSINTAAHGYLLTASSNHLTPAPATGLTITAGTATQLVLTTPPPTRVKAGSAFTLVVAAEDRYGNVDTTFHAPVTLALDANPGNAVLQGPINVIAVDGSAVFSGLTLDTAGNGYTLSAQAGTLTAARSNSIDGPFRFDRRPRLRTL